MKKNGQDPVVIRLAGDSGDGVQLLGKRVAHATGDAGLDLHGVPDYPAEIRAPVGTLYGVSSFQLRIGSGPISNEGDEADILVALNPAALAVNLDRLHEGAVIILDEDQFTARGLKKAHLAADPRTDSSLASYRVLSCPIERLTRAALKAIFPSKSRASQCRNFWALGLIHYLFSYSLDGLEAFLQKRFRHDAQTRQANAAAAKAGYIYGDTQEISPFLRPVQPAPDKIAGETINGAAALAFGLRAAAALSRRKLFFASYPITPASPLLHLMAKEEAADASLQVFQAEDEIAAIGAAIGAAFGGALGVTSTSGPGMALKSEMLGLGVAVELPLLIINAQRAGPSTGMPTKTEQADLQHALYGRPGDAPLPVIAAAHPEDAFFSVFEAVLTAIRFMTPVILLTDGYVSNSIMRWNKPSLEDLRARYPLLPPWGKDFPVTDACPNGTKTRFADDDARLRFILQRNPHTQARQWITPGTAFLMHRVGGLERTCDTGKISSDAANHIRMGKLRAAKIEALARELPDLALIQGDTQDTLLVLGWGSTLGILKEAIYLARREGLRVAQAHLRWMHPLPTNLRRLLDAFAHVSLAEMNDRQAAGVLRAAFAIDIHSIGNDLPRPWKSRDLLGQIKEHYGRLGKN